MSATPTTGGRRSEAGAATQSLQVLLRDDRLLTQHELHVGKNSQEAAFSYAAALLKEEGGAVQQRASIALQEVERKLALVQSLAERVSRTSPEAVAGPLLRLHGYASSTLEEEEEEQDDEKGTLEEADESHALTEESTASGASAGPTQTTTLLATRDRCRRLHRQGEVLEGVAKRVESSLTRASGRMEIATNRLTRVLALSSTLKMILRLQFESTKLLSFDLDDLRDLTRAAASISIIEDLLTQISSNEADEPTVVKSMRPGAEAIGARVREAASTLLQDCQSKNAGGVIQLGATLQVYYHLGELPQAAWYAVRHGLQEASKVCDIFWSPSAITSLVEKATAQAKASSKTESALQRNLQKRLREHRREAAAVWSVGLVQAAQQVWSLHRVLSRKSDPTSRQLFAHVVAQADIPEDLQMGGATSKDGDFSVFSIFWHKLCLDLGQRLQHLLDTPKLASDVAALYPSVRSAVLEMLGRLYDVMQAAVSSSSASLEDVTGGSVGILGGSGGLDMAFGTDTTEILGGTGGSADTWTRTANTGQDDTGVDGEHPFMSSGATTTSLSAIFGSDEWKAMQETGLAPLQQAFLQSCSNRLCTPIQFMFPEGLNVDDDGHAVQVLPALPSRYDLQKMDHSIRAELSLADPREGGGDLSMTGMIAEVVVDMTEIFCARAKTAVTESGEEGCLEEDGTPTENHLHDLKVANVMSSLANALKNAPDNTFVVPYRPATSSQHEEAANLCRQGLKPALMQIEKMVKTLILGPLCRAINRRITASIARMHHGMYLESSLDMNPESGQSFVQKHLVGLYETIANEQLSKLPADYAVIVASTVATFSIYTFVSNASLIRPLGEAARLRITQDLADFEMALEQLVLKGGGSLTLSQVAQGKPYAELRAVRQMFYWTGLDNKTLSASSVAKAMLREVWVKDVRPSTAFHYLFSFAPTLLSSPHHSKRMRAEEYVGTLVKLDGSTEEGEANSWMTTLACCDSYQQRESVDGGGRDGDRRVAAILMMLGPELLRRRRH